ncbi:MAG: 1-acyl-sn-glycerol-3-phosphate acyltransferase [Chloroflexota bacterium]
MQQTTTHHGLEWKLPTVTLEACAWWSLRAWASFVAWRNVGITVDGLEHIPTYGPVILAARHVHHLYDGCALLSVVPRPLHLMVALDWARSPWQRWLLESATTLARWPGVIRSESFALNPDHQYTVMNQRARLRRAIQESQSLLADGRALLTFPEGYPIVDPWPGPPRNAERLLPFRRGFVHLARRATRECAVPIPIVPVGLRYESGSHRHLCLRLGHPEFATETVNENALAALVRQRVDELSRP